MNVHLHDDQIIRSLVDKTDLPAAVREHLASCPQCRAARENLKRTAVRLGDLARMNAPTRQKTIRLPGRKPQKTAWWSRDWRTLSALGAAAGIVLVIGVLLSLHTIQERSQAKLYDEMIKDERFMSEINLLQKSDLPQSWLDISGESEVNINEEMLELISPSS